MYFYGNGFQSIMDARIQKEIFAGNFGKQEERVSKLVMDYIIGIPFSNNQKSFDNDVYANAKIAKDNFINYWTRVLSLDEEKKYSLNELWENSIYEENECAGVNGPLLVLNGRGIMTQDSFFEMIFKVVNC